MLCKNDKVRINEIKLRILYIMMNKIKQSKY